MDTVKVSVFLILISLQFTVGFLDDASNADVSVVKVRLSEEKSKRLLLQNDIETLMLKTEKMERQIKALMEFLPQTRQTDSARMIYFNVKLSKHTTLDSQHILVFDTILDNVGEGYSPSTGIFRAPVSGLYQFSLSILSVLKNKYAHIQIMRNDREIGRVLTADRYMGSVTVTKQLTEGEEVYCREFHATAGGHVHGDNFNSFSGVLLFG